MHTCPRCKREFKFYYQLNMHKNICYRIPKPADLVAIYTDLDNDHTIKSLANLYGVSIAAVFKALKHAGLTKQKAEEVAIMKRNATPREARNYNEYCIGCDLKNCICGLKSVYHLPENKDLLKWLVRQRGGKLA